MKKQEKQLEMEVNGIPDLSKAPKDLLQLFCEAMLEVIELSDKELRQTYQFGLIVFCFIQMGLVQANLPSSSSNRR